MTPYDYSQINHYQSSHVRKKFLSIEKKFHMSRRTPALSALRCFAVFSRLGSISQAANELNLTISAVGHQIRALEAFIGVALVDRKGRNLTLTEQGAIYGDQIRIALEDIAVATDSIKNRGPIADADKIVRLAVLPSFAYSWLIPRLSDFRNKYPEIRLQIQISSDYCDLNTANTDCALRFGHGNWTNAHIQPLMKDTLLLVGSQNLINDHNQDVKSRLLEMPFIHSVESWSTWLATNPNQDVICQRPNIKIEFSDTTHLLKAISLGLGIALTRGSLTYDLIELGELALAHNHVCLHSSSYYILFPTNKRPSIYTEIFSNWVKEQCLAFIDKHRF